MRTAETYKWDNHVAEPCYSYTRLQLCKSTADKVHELALLLGMLWRRQYHLCCCPQSIGEGQRGNSRPFSTELACADANDLDTPALSSLQSKAIDS